MVLARAVVVVGEAVDGVDENSIVIHMAIDHNYDDLHTFVSVQKRANYLHCTVRHRTGPFRFFPVWRRDGIGALHRRFQEHVEFVHSTELILL